MVSILRRGVQGPFGAAALGASMVGGSDGHCGLARRRPPWSWGGHAVTPASMGEGEKAWCCRCDEFHPGMFVFGSRCGRWLQWTSVVAITVLCLRSRWMPYS
jgi:hypothetical protein